MRTWTYFSVDNEDLEYYVLAYATKHKICLYTLSDVTIDREELQTNADKIKLRKTTAYKNDPGLWGKTFREYEEDYGPVGGDQYDVTTWSSDERKEHSFDEKDALSSETIKDLEAGLVIQLA